MNHVKNTYNLFIACILISFTLNSCEPSTSIHWRVFNNSQDEITITTNLGGVIDFNTISARATIILTSELDAGILDTHLDQTREVIFENIEITNADMIDFSRDELNLNNWQAAVLNRSEGEFRLTVNNQDFQ